MQLRVNHVFCLFFTLPVQSIPYMGPIRGGLREGTHIYIAGSIPKDISM